MTAPLLGVQKVAEKRPLQRRASIQHGVFPNLPTRKASKERLQVRLQEVEQGTGAVWGRIAALFAASILAAGLVPGQSENIALLADEGVFSSRCGDAQAVPCDAQYAALTGVFNLLAVSVLCAFGPVGYAFDDHGGRAVGTLGAGLTLLGYVCMQIPILGARSSADASTCLVTAVALALTDVGSMMNSYSLYSLIYHLPGRSTFLISLSNCSLGCAAFLPSVMRGFMAGTGSGLSGGMALLSVLAAVAMLACWRLTPTRQEFHFAAQRALGTPLPKVRMSGSWRQARSVGRIFAHDWRLHLAVWLFLVLSWTFTLLYLGLAVDYGTALFGAAGGRRLATDLAWLIGVCNIFVGPWSGLFVDRFGLRVLAALMALVAVVVAASCGGRSWSAQGATCTGIALMGSVVLNFAQRHVLDYVPPNRLGMGQGLFIGSLSIGLLPLNIAAMVWIATLPSGPGRFAAPFGCIAWLAAGVGCTAMLWYAWKGPPSSQVLLPEDEQSLAMGFGCALMSQVEEVVGLPQRDVMRTLSRGEPAAINGLVSRVDYGKLRDVLLRSSPPLDDPSDAFWNAQAYLEGRLAMLPGFDGSVCAVGPESAEAAACCAAEAFMGTSDVDPEPMNDWILGATHRGLAAAHSRSCFYLANFRFLVHMSQAFGCLLGARDVEGDMQGVALLFPPGRLLPDGHGTGKVGGGRYVHALRKAGALPAYLDTQYGMGVRIRTFATMVDAAAMHENLALGPHWYIMVLGVSPRIRGRGIGKALLSAVNALADQDGVPCYVEAAGEKNRGIYERFGYSAVYTLTVEVDDEAFEPMGRSDPLDLYLMVRQPCRAAEQLEPH